MVTKIILKGEGLSTWIAKKAGQVDNQDLHSLIVAELPDKPGLYETPYGRIGLNFAMTEIGDFEVTSIMVLDCQDVRILQSRERRERRMIDIRRDGTGSQLIGRDVELTVATNANLTGCRYNRREAL